MPGPGCWPSQSSPPPHGRGSQKVVRFPMSTIITPSKPINPALVDSEHYIDEQIRRTRRTLKLVDLAAGLITLAIGLLGFVLLAAVLDHWVVPGGLSEAGRAIVFG